jgi:hypothetical protein
MMIILLGWDVVNLDHFSDFANRVCYKNLKLGNWPIDPNIWYNMFNLLWIC